MKVFVVPQPHTDINHEEIVYWCANRLAQFKVPLFVVFRDDLPRTPTMRIRKDVLRKESSGDNSEMFDRDLSGIQLKQSR